MFCKKCGAELKDGQEFCTKCGAPTSASGQTGQTIDLKKMASGAAGQVISRSKAAAGKNSGLLLTNIVLVFLSIIAIAFMSFFTSTNLKDIISSLEGSSMKDLADTPSSVGLHLFLDTDFSSNFLKVLFFLAPSVLTLVMMILSICGKTQLSAWNFIPFIVAGIIYVIIEFVMMAFMSESKYHTLTFGAWLFLLCTIAGIVLSFILISATSKAKRQNEIETMARAFAQANNQNNNR